MAAVERDNGKGFTLVLGVVLAAAVFANAAYHVSWILRESDLWWHIRSGQLMLSTRQMPYTDTFSYTFDGQPWIAKEWLSQVIYALSYNLVGWAGPLLLAAAAIAVTAFLFYRNAAQSLQPFYAAALTLCAVFLVQGVTVARPHVLTFPLAVVLVVALFDAARQKSGPPFWTLAITLLWSNLHGSFPIAFIVAGCAFIDVLERSRMADRKLVLRWLVYLALTVAVTVINPYFIKPYQVALALAGGLSVMKEISEWAPFTIPHDRIAEVGLFVVLLVLLKVRARLTLGQIAFLLLMLNMMFSYTRFIYAFFLLVPLAVLPEVVEACPVAAWQAWAARKRDGLETFAGRHARLLAGVVVATSSAYAIFLMSGQRVVPPEDVSVSGAIAYVKGNVSSNPALQKHVLNDYNFGGPLILAGFKTYVDGRSDQLFGGEFMQNYLASGGDRGQVELEKVLADPAIGWTIFPPLDPRNAALASEAGWVKAYGDDTAVIYVRR